ncbi:MAG: hypothetical protein ACRC4W_02495 [Treponemataceae bacterium]
MAKASGPFQSHTLDNRRFTCDAEDSAELTPQGKTNEVKPNGDGSNRVVQKRVAGVIEGINLVIDPARGDLEFLQNLRDSGDFFDYSGTDNGDNVWAGKVQITSEVKLAATENTVEISLAGKFELQG